MWSKSGLWHFYIPNYMCKRYTYTVMFRYRGNEMHLLALTMCAVFENSCLPCTVDTFFRVYLKWHGFVCFWDSNIITNQSHECHIRDIVPLPLIRWIYPHRDGSLENALLYIEYGRCIHLAPPFMDHIFGMLCKQCAQLNLESSEVSVNLNHIKGKTVVRAINVTLFHSFVTEH